MPKTDKLKNENLRHLLDEQVFKIQFKEIRAKILGTLFMVCEFLDENGEILARGISIRSLLDGFNRKTGKNKAFGRAVKALKNEENADPIRNNDLIPDAAMRRFQTCKNGADISSFEEITKVTKSYKRTDEGFHYVINPFLPLMLVKAKSIQFKSEYCPDRVDFEV